MLRGLTDNTQTTKQEKNETNERGECTGLQHNHPPRVWFKDRSEALRTVSMQHVVTVQRRQRIGHIAHDFEDPDGIGEPHSVMRQLRRQGNARAGFGWADDAQRLVAQKDTSFHRQQLWMRRNFPQPIDMFHQRARQRCGALHN